MTITQNNDELAQAQSAAISAVQDAVANYFATVPASRVNDVRQITNALEQSMTVARRAAGEIHAARNNLDIHPDGRHARAASALEEGRDELREIYSSAHAQVEILSAALESEALAPPKGAADAALARQDAALILGVAKNPVRALEALGSDPDLGLATLAASPWGRRYLTAIGADNIDTAMTAVKHAALTNVADREAGGSHRAQAARARLEINTLNSAIAGYESVTSALLS